MAEPVDWHKVIGYSDVAQRGPLLAISGAGPLGDDGKVVPGDAGDQARRCLTRIEERLNDAGATLADVVLTRIYMTQDADWQAVGRTHGEFFGTHRPATTMIRADTVFPEFQVEIEALAWVPEKEG